MTCTKTGIVFSHHPFVVKWLIKEQPTSNKKRSTLYHISQPNFCISREKKGEKVLPATQQDILVKERIVTGSVWYCN
jgi:hypothetical protein